MLSIEETVPSCIVDHRPTTLRLELDVVDPEVVEELLRHPPGGRRDDVAKAALRLGILALGQARGALDADQVRRQAEELLDRLENALDGALVEQRERLLHEFSLDNQSSALCRLVREVGTSNSGLRDDLKDDLIAMGRELSLDNGEGGLARLRREVLVLVTDMTTQNDHFHNEVRSTLEQMQVRRREAARSTRHGLEFENALGEALMIDCRARDELLEACGYTTGRVPRSKKGDFVITLSPDCVAAGARIVVEAKEHRSYNLPMALAEIEAARRNRDARVGLFVFSQRAAPEGIDRLLRHGQDIVTVWDQDDPGSDIFLQAALSLARALSTRPGNGTDPSADFRAIDDAVLRIGKRTEELEQLVTWSKTIEHNGLKIREKSERIKQDLEDQLGRLLIELDSLRESE